MAAKISEMMRVYVDTDCVAYNSDRLLQDAQDEIDRLRDANTCHLFDTSKKSPKTVNSLPDKIAQWEKSLDAFLTKADYVLQWEASTKASRRELLKKVERVLKRPTGLASEVAHIKQRLRWVLTGLHGTLFGVIEPVETDAETHKAGNMQMDFGSADAVRVPIKDWDETPEDERTPYVEVRRTKNFVYAINEESLVHDADEL
jgi:hypothetical protein